MTKRFYVQYTAFGGLLRSEIQRAPDGLRGMPIYMAIPAKIDPRRYSEPPGEPEYPISRSVATFEWTGNYIGDSPDCLEYELTDVKS